MEKLGNILKGNGGIVEFTYLMYDGRLYKIGRSMNVKSRLNSIKTSNPFCKLIHFGVGASESYLHERFSNKRVVREWFDLSKDEVDECVDLLQTNIKEIEIEYTKNNMYNYDTYVLDFGKYRGRLLSSLKTSKELKYCLWLYFKGIYAKFPYWDIHSESYLCIIHKAHKILNYKDKNYKENK